MRSRLRLSASMWTFRYWLGLPRLYGQKGLTACTRWLRHPQRPALTRDACLGMVHPPDPLDCASVTLRPSRCLVNRAVGRVVRMPGKRRRAVWSWSTDRSVDLHGDPAYSTEGGLVGRRYLWHLRDIGLETGSFLGSVRGGQNDPNHASMGHSLRSGDDGPVNALTGAKERR